MTRFTLAIVLVVSFLFGGMMFSLLVWSYSSPNGGTFLYDPPPGAHQTIAAMLRECPAMKSMVKERVNDGFLSRTDYYFLCDYYLQLSVAYPTKTQ